MTITTASPFSHIKNTPSLWMSNPKFDLSFFHISGLLCLLLLIPYLFFGNSVIFPIYNFYLIFFGIPHNYLTWATLVPKNSRKTFQMDQIYTAAIICLVISLLIPLTVGSEINDWILSFIAYASLWHAYRQHHGICKVYDAIQANRTNDFTIFEDRKYMNIFFGFALNGVLVWAFTHPNIEYFLSANEKYKLIYPVIPQNIYELYIISTIVLGLIAFKKCVWNRLKQNKHIPWPQISLMLIAISTYIIPYFFIPLTAMPLAVAIGTIYHNIQYFGFVWMFERYRTKELISMNIPLQMPQLLVHKKSWVKYFGIALLYSFIMIAIYSVTPHQIGLTLIYFLALAHYIIDGYIWRKNNNSLLNPVIKKISMVEG